VQIVLLLRLVPLLPFNMLNYLLSVTPVGIGEYMLASWLGMMVGFSFLPLYVLFTGGYCRISSLDKWLGQKKVSLLYYRTRLLAHISYVIESSSLCNHLLYSLHNYNHLFLSGFCIFCCIRLFYHECTIVLWCFLSVLYFLFYWYIDTENFAANNKIIS